MVDLSRAGFWASLFVSFAGCITALGGLAYGEQACRDRPELNFASGPGATCAGVLSLYWVTVGLQLLFLLSAAVCAAAQSIHSFRSTLWSLGATATALGIKTANQAYSTLPLFAFANPQGYDAQVAVVVGVGLFIGGNLAAAFFGDAQYRAKRLAGADGFVTFRSTSFKAAEDADKQVAEEGIADDTPVASKAGLVGWVFLASAALSVAGTFIALGGIGALQAYCDDNGVLGHVNILMPCNRELTLHWVVWALQFTFLLVTGVCYARKQVHTYRASLWSAAGVVTALSSFVAHSFIYDLSKDGEQAADMPAWTAALVGFIFIVFSDFVLIISGDYLYRLKHVEGADGFVSMRRPGPYSKPADAVAGGSKPRRPIEWAFFLSMALVGAGTVVALGGLAGAQANCTPEELTWRGRGDRCSRFLSYPWFAVALEIVVLAGTIAAWAHSFVHSFKASLWSLATVVTFVCCVSANWVFMSFDFSTGATHESLVAAFWGLAIMAGGNFCLMATGDGLHNLRREENAAGFVTFRRPKLGAPKPTAGGDSV